MNRLYHLGRPKSALGEELDPALHCAEIPWSRFGKFPIDCGPRSLAPTVGVGQIAAGSDGMRGLNDQSSAVAEKNRRAAKHPFDRLLSDQRKIRDRHVDAHV